MSNTDKTINILKAQIKSLEAKIQRKEDEIKTLLNTREQTNADKLTDISAMIKEFFHTYNHLDQNTQLNRIEDLVNMFRTIFTNFHTSTIQAEMVHSDPMYFQFIPEWNMPHTRPIGVEYHLSFFIPSVDHIPHVHQRGSNEPMLRQVNKDGTDKNESSFLIKDEVDKIFESKFDRLFKRSQQNT